jgi:hypothetical protein
VYQHFGYIDGEHISWDVKVGPNADPSQPDALRCAPIRRIVRKILKLDTGIFLLVGWICYTWTFNIACCENCVVELYLDYLGDASADPCYQGYDVMHSEHIEPCTSTKW